MKKLTIILSLITLVSASSITYAQSVTPATDTGKLIQDKVREKIELSKNKPKAYYGIITDISSSSIQIKNQKSEIQFITIDKQKLTLVKMGTTNKNIKFEDIAIGDFIMALGTVGENNVLNALRIISTTPPANPNRLILLGTVADSNKNSLNLNTIDSDFKITSVKNIDITKNSSEGSVIKIKFTDINDGDKVIVIGTQKDSSIEARKIYVVKSVEPSPTPTKKPTPTKP